MSINRYLKLLGVVLVALLVAFLVVEALRVPILTEPGAHLREASAATALVGGGLLVVDVVLPVPSSVVMTAHGALFGVVGGTLLSLAGSVGAAMVGYAIGRRGAPVIERHVTAAERERAERLLDRWGTAAIVASRPIPLLAETVAMLAGASAMGPARVALAATVGSLPPALAYALAGSAAEGIQSTVFVFVAVALLTGAAALLAPRLQRTALADVAADRRHAS